MSLEMVHGDTNRRFRFSLDPLVVPPSRDGLFAPDSVVRRVYSDTAIFGAGRALLLQLAHPSVAQGVYEHSDYAGAPLDRLLGTSFAMANVVYGSRAYIEHLGRILSGVHAKVTGEGYSALDPDLVCWVNATLADTALAMYERLVRPLTSSERDEFFSEGRAVAEVFGCPIDRQPADAAEFHDYWESSVASLEVTDVAREIADSLLGAVGLPLRPLWLAPMWVARALTAATLPPRIRDDFGLAWGPPQKAASAAVFAVARPVTSRMPDRWRQSGAWLLRSPEPDLTGKPGGQRGSTARA